MRIIGLILLYVVVPALIGFWLFSAKERPQLTQIPYALPEGVNLKNSKMYFQVDKPLTFALTQSPRKVMLHFVGVTHSNIAKHKPFEFQVALNIRCQSQTISKTLSFLVNKQSDIPLLGTDIELPAAFLEKVDNQTLQVSELRRVHYEIPENCGSLDLDVVKKSSFIDFVGFQVYQQVLRSTRVDPLDVWQRLSLEQKNDLADGYPFDLDYLSEHEKFNLAKYRWQPLIPNGSTGKSFKMLNHYSIPKEFTEDKAINEKAYPHLSDVYKTVTFPISEQGEYYFQAEHNLNQRKWHLTMRHYDLNDNPTDIQHFPFNESKIKHSIQLTPGLVTFNASIPVHMALYSEDVQLQEHEHYIPTFLVRSKQQIIYDVKHSAQTLTPIKISLRSFTNIDYHSHLPAKAKVEVFNEHNIVERYSVSLPNATDTHQQMSGYDFAHWLSLPAESYLYLNKQVTHVKISSPTDMLVSAATRVPSKPGYRYLPEQKRGWFDFEDGIPDWFGIQPQYYEGFVETGAIQMLYVYHRSLHDDISKSIVNEYQSLLIDNQEINSKLVIEEALVQEPYTAVQYGTQSTNDNEPQTSFFKLLNNQHDIYPKRQPTRLFFVRDEKQPTPIYWSIDGQSQAPFYIAGKWGVVELSNLLPQREGRLKVENSQAQWFINQLPNKPVESKMAKKQIMKLPANQWKELKINKKQASELLLFTVLSEESNKNNRVNIDLDLSLPRRKNTLYSEASIKKMHYSLKMEPTNIAVKLSSNTEFHSKQSFVYSLKQDITNTQFTLRVKSNQDVYVAISQQHVKNKEQIIRYRYDQEH